MVQQATEPSSHHLDLQRSTRHQVGKKLVGPSHAVAGICPVCYKSPALHRPAGCCHPAGCVLWFQVAGAATESWESSKQQELLSKSLASHNREQGTSTESVFCALLLTATDRPDEGVKGDYDNINEY